MDSSDSLPFGDLLRTFRERRQPKMSQQALANALGVDRQTIVAWETGKYLPRDRTRVMELAQQLHLDEQATNRLLQAALLELLPPWHVPYHRNLVFTGREKILQELRCVLIPGVAAAVTQSRALSGLGGIGKTQTVLEYIYRYRQDYTAVLWLQADSRDILFSACVRLAQELGLPERNEADQSRVVAAVKRWLKSKTRWLLVLDNVEDLTLVEEFLPPGHQGCVVLTTRAQTTDPIAEAYELEPLPEEEGALLLLRRAGLLARKALLEQAFPEDATEAKVLWELVEGLPLALDQIGAYVRASRCSLAHYRSLYVDQQRRLDLLKLRGKLPSGHPASVTTTFSVAFEKVQVLNEAAAELLQVCALLHPKDIPEELITQAGEQLSTRLASLATDPVLLDQAIEALQTYSLVRREGYERVLSIHRLVQAVQQDAMSSSEQEEWTKRLVTALDTIFPNVEPTTWGRCARLVPHALVCVARMQSLKSTNPDLASLLFKTGCYLADRAQYIEAETLHQQALAIREQLLGRDHFDTITSMSALGVLYYEQGKYGEAEFFLLEALQKREKILGFTHPSVVKIAKDLGELYYMERKYDKAGAIFHKVLQTGLGPSNPDVAESQLHLALIYRNQGKLAEVEPLLKTLLEVSEQAFGAEHVDTARILRNLAGVYVEQGRYAEAEPLLERALRIRERVLGPTHPWVAKNLKGLAMLYQNQGRHAEAEPLLERALRIREQALGPVHLQTIESLHDLAVFYYFQGRYLDAEPLYSRVLKVVEKMLEQNPGVVAGMEDIASLYYRSTWKREDIEALFTRGLEVFEKNLGPTHPSVAQVLSYLGEFCFAQKRYEEAEQIYIKLLQIKESTMVLDDPKMIETLNRLVIICQAQGKYIEAEQIFSSVLAVLGQSLGITHPHVITLQENYDTLVQDMQRHITKTQTRENEAE
jgi:tetratricopeptide (TPR) repeat protein/DNA-binding XRE family transcriptional regulator